LRSKVLWSASSWPSCFGPFSLVSPVTVASTGDDSPELAGGRTVKSRRRFITDFVIALMPLGATASAQEYKAQQQQSGNVHRIGLLGAHSPSAQSKSVEAGLRDLGYVEGKNIVIEYRWAEGKYDRLPTVAAELAALKVNVIVTTGGTPPALSAKRATTTIPIVMTGVGDAVGTDLVATLARPGGNITG
jgi:ABC-type uncharacterized transport system substrate-binding protein